MGEVFHFGFGAVDMLTNQGLPIFWTSSCN